MAPSPVFKVKIPEVDLHGALKSGYKNGSFVAVWRDSKSSQKVVLSSMLSRETSRGGGRTFTVCCWNCRGFASSVPYIQNMLGEKPGVMVLSEHWLWPYELDKLNDISEEYMATGKADARLTEESAGGRGCGGIGIL